MTNQDVKSAIKSLDEVSTLLDALGELEYLVDAIGIISENLMNTGLRDYWDDQNEQQAYRNFCRVHTQINMMNEFSRRAKKFLEGYEEKIVYHLDISDKVLSGIIVSPCAGKLLLSFIIQLLETCNSFVVDNSVPPDYYYY